MGYQLVIWEGSRPESDAAANDTWRETLANWSAGIHRPAHPAT